MIFSSPSFLFLFLPLTIFIYHVLFNALPIHSKSTKIQIQNLFLLFSSLLFYVYSEMHFVFLLFTSCFIDYLCALGIAAPQPHLKSSRKKIFLTISIAANLSILGTFKYFNFFIDNIKLLSSTIFSSNIFDHALEISLPIGISFYTFQSMSYTIDVYRGRVKPTKNFINFFCYVSMFPQLIAGPIIRYKDIAKDLTHRTLTTSLFSSGVKRFIFGLSKKVLIADTLSPLVDKIFSLPHDQLSPELAWLAILGFTLQIYFDFSGYSDMAIGLGRMFGFRFVENFNHPYISRSLREFWKRWHISLSNWFKDYLYISLGGNRLTPLKTIRNLLIVFFLCGLWHGAQWNFILWGIFHGCFLVFERKKLFSNTSYIKILLQHIYVLLMVVASWVLFRCDNIDHALTYYEALLGINAHHAPYSAIRFLSTDVLIAFISGGFLCLPLNTYKNKLLAGYIKKETLLYSAISTILIVSIFWISIFSAASKTHNPFVYFRF